MVLADPTHRILITNGGLEIDASGKPHLYRLERGLWVVGNGIVECVSGMEEGRTVLAVELAAYEREHSCRRKTEAAP
jgi:hypothetical protein